MKHLNRLALSLAAALSLLTIPAFAGGPLLVRAPGQPYRWPNGGRNIPFNPDLGGFGTLTNAEAVAQTAAAFGAWEAIPSATATYVNAGALDVDVDITNFFPYFIPSAPDGKSAIVYDEDGSIFDLLFGPGSGVLGFASPEWIDGNTGDILEGVSFMNGGQIFSGFPASEFLSVQVHEFGHYSNLAHTVVNGQIALDDTTGPFPDGITFPAPASLSGRIETMYPFLFVGGGQETPHADDIAIFSTLYPEPSFAGSTGNITGRILAPNGRTLLTGVNVIARNLANPFDDAVSAISSDFTDDFTNRAPLVGTYTLRGLTPGADYAVYTDGIFAGGFSTPPRSLPGPEEFWNGAEESNDPSTDDPLSYSPVRAGSGTTRRGIDIVFNRILPGPLALGDDDSVELWPTAPIRMCGIRYDSLWLNSNGSLTFGAPSTAFTESRDGLLSGPPRIAGLWDDLDPTSGGVVAFEESADGLRVSFEGVPQYGVGDENTFSIDLLAGDSSRFRLSYGSLGATDGLVGYGCGSSVSSGYETESNLSALGGAINGRGKTAVFEQFGGDSDVAGLALDVRGAGGFRDQLEPNNVLAAASPVALPFVSLNRFTDIRGASGDVDYYRFTAKAGDWLVAETIPGTQVDTVLGLYAAGGGPLLASDDDGGSGLLSRILWHVPADGEYAIAVSTYPDLGFTGAGGDAGRYVLSLLPYHGTALNTTRLGDDSAIEVPIDGFAFPFQGASWTSVFVQANGNLTFGDAGDPELTENVPYLLDGPPRIAPFWADLDPSGFGDGSSDPFPPGLVLVDQQPDSLTVHYASVPGFGGAPPNYFSTRLNRDGTFQMAWGPVDRDRFDAIVAVSEGNGAADPGPVDLSATRTHSAAGTTYEDFSRFGSGPGSFDLVFRDLVFLNPR